MRMRDRAPSAGACRVGLVRSASVFKNHGIIYSGDLFTVTNLTKILLHEKEVIMFETSNNI